jgi:hypothetical protein
MALHIQIIIICKGFHLPWKNPRYSLYRSLGGPQNRSGSREEKHLAPAGNPTTAVQPVARRDATDTGVIRTECTLFHIYFSLDFFYACLLLPTSPSWNSGFTKRIIFPWQRVLRMDPKEKTSQLLLTGRCLATDPRKWLIPPLVGRWHSNVPKKNWPQRQHLLCLATGDAYEY